MCSRLCFFVILSLAISFKPSLQCTSMAEYPLSGLVTTTTSISSSISPGSQPVLNFPSVVNPPSTTNDPIVTNAGLWITPQKYVIPSGIWSQSSTTCTELNFWFFQISGYIGEFAGVGLKMGNIIARYITLTGDQSGSNQNCNIHLGTQTFTVGQIKHGWNIVSFEMCNDYMRYNICQSSGCAGAVYGYYPGYGDLTGSEVLHIGCLNCVGSDISYLIQSVHSTMTPITCVPSPIPNSLPNAYYTSMCGNMVRDSGEGCDDGNVVSGDGCNEVCSVEVGWICTGGSSTTQDTCTEICGDGKRFNTLTTYCDDGNTASGDGCSSTCSIETGWSCTGGSTTSQDTCTEICGDGKRFNTLTAYCDDGNTASGDGCSSTCSIETGWSCTGGSTTSQDTCKDICGDGIIVKSTFNYCDDGNTNNRDGCSSTCAIETGWTCTGGSNSSPSVCSEKCGDGITIVHNSLKCDDGNTVSDDGCSSACFIEHGWGCIGGSPTSTDVCTVICGDGIYMSAAEQCDDGNIASGDGCSQMCKLESGFSCTTTASNNPATVCHETCGNGIRMLSTGCDDGNTVSGDGCSSTCTVESGYSCQGGSPISPDVCLVLCGDGKIDSSDPSVCDDGNNIDGDGCSSTCKVEVGFKCVHTATTPDVCTEICGDGRRIGPTGCDDGNTLNGDGCSSTCHTEPGFTCSGGSSMTRDVCTEICGDSKNYGGLECDDGNTTNGDGCSSTCEYETCYECTGGTPTSPDVCSKLQIAATIGTVAADNSVDISFNHTMLNATIGLNDLYVQIDASSSITFSWSAAYTNSTVLHLQTNVNQVLQGTEILHIKFINSKRFRGPHGGCVRPDMLNATMPNSLASSVQTASSASNPIKFITMIGILLIVGCLLLIGSSLELIWSLVNTLQLISYLPLMVPNYPQHVQIMFELLGFTNFDIEFISSFVKNTLHLDQISAPSYDSRFLDNGIGNSLFLSNCASILFSLFLSMLTLTACATLYSVLWCSRLKNKMSSVVSSYFFNNFLRFFTEGYLEIYFGALLNVMTYDLGSPVEIASFVMSMFFLLLLVLFPFMSAALIYDKRKEIKDKHPVYLKRFGTMYQNFKLKGSWFCMQYYPIFLLRRLVFASFIIAAINYPEFQCNSFTLFSVMVFFYQLYLKPFKEDIINLLCCINEFCLAIISMIQVIFLTDFNSVSTIQVTGWVMVALMIAMVVINFMIIIPYSIYIKVKECKNKSGPEIRPDPVMTQSKKRIILVIVLN